MSGVYSIWTRNPVSTLCSSFNGGFGGILKRHTGLMLNRHDASKLNIQNAIKTQGQPWMIIRKCNHGNQPRLISSQCFPISGMLRPPAACHSHDKPWAHSEVITVHHHQFMAYWHPMTSPMFLVSFCIWGYGGKTTVDIKCSWFIHVIDLMLCENYEFVLMDCQFFWI